MAITTDDFNKIWASTSPLTPYEFSESQYKEGWNFIGGTPPSRQMWDFLQKNNDEKMQYLLNNFDKLANILVPTGCVQAFAGNTLPNGWLLCDGSAVSRTDYAELYSVIGDTYGAGDGSTTFNVPNLVDKFVEGSATSGTEKTAGLPNITGSWQARRYGSDSALLSAPSGAFTITNNGTQGYGTGQASNDVARHLVAFDASLSSSIYGNSTTVQPPALTMQYIIKY